MSRFNDQQIALLAEIVRVYAADLHDPTAIEVLLVIREVCRVLNVPRDDVQRVFGRRVLQALEGWGERPPHRSAVRAQRAWVWLPDRREPGLYRVEAGRIEVG